MSKLDLLEAGKTLIAGFCERNLVELPEVRVREPKEWRFGGVCAYYRPVHIEICPARCAHPGVAGRSWSWPGYSTDRTPYGVLAHETGHHADMLRSKRKHGYRGDHSISVRAEVGEERLTSYCPNDGEWFAEMFRLFITNPDLLRLLRPRTFERLSRDWLPVVKAPWDEVLRGAPQRTLDAAARKIEEVKRKGR